jgi:isopenicillin N synthase-like dioxygenase
MLCLKFQKNIHLIPMMTMSEKKNVENVFVLLDDPINMCVCVCVFLCRKSMEDYNKSLDKLTIQILELCAEGLGLKSSTFTEPYLGTAGDCIARFNYYPPCPLPSLTLGLGAHTDPNLLTILHQCSVGGLQICHGHGSWVSVKPSPNSFIINVGDSFEVCMFTSYPMFTIIHLVTTKVHIKQYF